MVSRERLRGYLDDTAKLALYRLLTTGDRDAIRAEEEKIFDRVLAEHGNFR